MISPTWCAKNKLEETEIRMVVPKDRREGETGLEFQCGEMRNFQSQLVAMAAQQCECGACRRSAHFTWVKTVSFMLHIFTTVNKGFLKCMSFKQEDVKEGLGNFSHV